MHNACIEININTLENNIKKINRVINNYKEKIIDLRNNCFGLGLYLVNVFYSLGYKYCYVTNLTEALKVRKYNSKINIIVKNEIIGDSILDAINNNIILTVSNLNYLQKLSLFKTYDQIRIHLLIDNGTNNIGLKSKEEVTKALEIINNKKIILEGAYTSITTLGYTDSFYYTQMANFLTIIESLDKDLLIYANEYIMYHNKESLINSIKIDLSVFGIKPLLEENNLKIKKIKKKYKNRAYNDNIEALELPWAIVGYITSINYSLENNLIGRNYYNKENIRIGFVNVGHKDGLTKALKVVVVNNTICEILTDTIDDMIIKINEDIKINDKVYLISEFNNIENVLLNLKTNRYYLMSIINSNLERIYLKDGEKINQGDY